MSTNLMTTGGISQRTNVYAEARMLAHAAPVTVLDKLAVTRQIPKNRSRTIKFRRPKNMEAATTPLVEGVTPKLTTFQYEDIETTLKQYGQVIGVTDVIEDTHEDPVLQDVTMMLGENIGRTVEALSWAVLRGGTSVYYANGLSRSAVNSKLTLSRQRAVTRFLQAQKAKMHTRVLSGSPNYSTFPIEAAYCAVAHTDLESDIRNLPGFVPSAQYGTWKTVSPHEIGSVENVRYILSPDLSPWEDVGGDPAVNGVKSTNGASADVYPIMYLGMDSFGTVALRGAGAVTPSIIPVGQRTKDDPLAQRGYAGWKTYFAAIRLNELWMVRLEVAVDDLAS